MREEARLELDRIDKLKAGQGMAEAYLFGRDTLDQGAVGAGVQYGHRIDEHWSAFADAKIGYQYGEQPRGLHYEGIAALRVVW